MNFKTINYEIGLFFYSKMPTNLALNFLLFFLNLTLNIHFGSQNLYESAVVLSRAI